MAYIKTLKDNELVGGQDNEDVYPITTTQAIYSQQTDGSLPKGVKHRKLEDRLTDHEEDAQELHRKSERLVVYLNNSAQGQTLEITGNSNVVSLTGSAQVETFGDEPAQEVTLSMMEECGFNIKKGATTLFSKGMTTEVSYILPDEVGTYTMDFMCRYNQVEKTVESKTYVNLRKYFGFADASPVDISTLGVSHFSNSVGCTVTIPVNGTGFKRIYFAVPSGMSISRVVQPDALNAPLAISLIGNVSRSIGDKVFAYKLYQSVDMVDSSVSKRLTIS